MRHLSVWAGCFILLNFQVCAEELSKIAFGSCLKESKPQPIWESIRATQPDLFILMGDNIYGDTTNMSLLRKKYRTLFQNSGFLKLLNSVPLLATWDDHDFGKNDAGKEFEKKEDSQAIFYDFFRPFEPESKKKRPGIYTSKVYGSLGRRIQVILLDTRYFRDSLEQISLPDPPYKSYVPTQDSSKTLLGRAQWEWLEKQLKFPADLRILVSSIEFNGERQYWEKWYNFPHERKRLLRLIDKTRAENLIIISGDRHQGFLSKMDKDTPYPIYEVTSSSLNLAFLSGTLTQEDNPYRIGDSTYDENFGFIKVDWDKRSTELQLRDIKGKVIRKIGVPFSELKLSLKE